MQAKHLLQLTLDMSNPTAETLAAISAVVGTIRNETNQQQLLRTIHEETGKLLKGAEKNEPVRELATKN